MISKTLAIDVLNAALSTGADFVEIFLEQTDSSSLLLENGKLESSLTTTSYGGKSNRVNCKSMFFSKII